MLNRMIQILEPYANWKNIFLGFVLIIFINVIIFPYALNQLKLAAPAAATPIDLEFSYTVDEVYEMIESYQEAGRKIYRQIEIQVDFLYPILYSITFILLLLTLLKKSYPKNPKMYRWALFPLLTFFADIFENIGILKMLDSYPEQLEVVAAITSFHSSIKWLSIGGIFLLILFLSLRVLLDKN